MAGVRRSTQKVCSVTRVFLPLPVSSCVHMAIERLRIAAEHTRAPTRYRGGAIHSSATPCLWGQRQVRGLRRLARYQFDGGCRQRRAPTAGAAEGVLTVLIVYS